MSEPYSADVVSTTGNFGSAMIVALWAYDGWNEANVRSPETARSHLAQYVAEELQDPSRNLPKAILLGVITIIIIYISINLAYLACVPPVVFATSGAVARDAAEAVIGGH